MRITLPNACAVAFVATVLLTPIHSANADADDDRFARLEARLIEMEARLAAAEKAQPAAAASVSEKRIAELEARLAEAEQETKEVKVLASNSNTTSSNGILGNTATFDILANSAWRNLRWTHEEQWAEIRPGISMDKVIELLGSPPRSIDSAKPRIDEVFYYETSLRDDGQSLRGKISFRKDKVAIVQKPDFDRQK